MKKKLMVKIIICSVLILVVALTIVLVVPIVTKQIEENKQQEEMRQDLDNMNITLKQESLLLPYQGKYDKGLYENENNDIIENSQDYAKYEKFVQVYNGGKLEIVGNVDISTIGEYEINYTITSEKGNTKTQKMKVEVKDLKKPELHIKNETIEINVGTKVDILDGITVEDNVDNAEELKTKITTKGTVDTNKIGEYTITYKVTDSAGLICEKSRTYKVTEKKNIKVGTTYIYRVYNQAYTNGYADNSITFQSNNKVTYIMVAGMSTICYQGTYSIKDDIITARVEVHDIQNNDSKTFRLKIKDKNTIVDTSNGKTYKIK